MTGSLFFFLSVFEEDKDCFLSSIVLIIIVVWGCLSVASSLFSLYACSLLANVFARFLARSYCLMKASNSSSADGYCFAASASFLAFSLAAASSISRAFFYFAVNFFLTGYFFFPFGFCWAVSLLIWGAFPSLFDVSPFGLAPTGDDVASASTSLTSSSCRENILFFFFFPEAVRWASPPSRSFFVNRFN